MNRLLLFVLAICFVSCNSGGKKAEKKESKLVVVVKFSFADSLLNKTRWEIRDYAAAIAFLKKMRQEDEPSLTGYLHGDGRALFEKMVDHTGYPGLLTENIDQNKQVMIWMEAFRNGLVKLFMDSDRKNGKYGLGHELIRSFIAALALDRLMAFELNELFPDKEILADVQKNGWEKINTASFQLIRAALITIHTDHSLYEKEDIIDLSRFVASHIQQMRSFLDKEPLEQIDRAVETVKRSGAPEEAKQAFAQ